MKDIKFRGKRFYNNKWIYGNLFIDKDGERYILENDYLEQDGHHLVCNSDTPVFMMEETVGQYTGLKDCNGKEIFEGDIVKYSTDDKNYAVYYNELTAQFTTTDRWLWGYDDIEIVGNIHDDPELLQSKL